MNYLLILLFVFTGCQEKPRGHIPKEECIAAIKQVSDQNTVECMKQVKASLAKVKDAAIAANSNCVVIRPKAGKLTVLSFKTGKIGCFCNTTMYRHDDPKCTSKQCSADWTVDLKVDNGSARKGDEIHVECVFYNLRNTQQYILRAQDFFKASIGESTWHTFKANPHDYQLRGVDTNTPIGVNCFVVDHPRPPVNAVAKVTGFTDTTHDKRK